MRPSQRRTKKDRLANAEIMLKNKELARDAQEFYTNGTVADLPMVIEDMKDRKVSEIIRYAQEHTVPVKNKNGETIGTRIMANPLVISNYFFKSICPFNSKEPLYNAEQLDIVFDYYNYLIAEINDKVGVYPSSLTQFCKLAGLTLSTLRNYRESNDINMRIVVQKIFEQIGDDNLALSQMGNVKERTTFYKISSQNEINEKVQPKVNISIRENVNTQRLDSNLEKYKALLEKK